MFTHGKDEHSLPLPLRRHKYVLFVEHLISFLFVQGGERYKFPNSNPFVEEDMDKSEVASVAYR